MGVTPDPRYPKDPQEFPRKQKRKPKMCNAQQQSPSQNTAWQGVYPDLSALNELFSTQQATAANAGQPSPWIGFLASLGLQPISGGQTHSNNKQDLSRNHLPHQHLRLRDKRVTPMPEQTLLLGVGLNTNHLQEHPNNLAVTPAATPAVLPTSPNSSRRSPTACSTSPRSPPGPPSPYSASSPSSASSPACPASSSSPPSTWCSPPLSSACPCPPCSQATCSTPPSPSSTPSAPSSSSCPACTSCMFEASPWEIPLAGVSGSLAPTQLGTKM